MNTAVAEQQANPFGSRAVAERSNNAAVQVEQQRAIAEVQAALIIARQNPRDPIEASDMILQDCTRPTLAAVATYDYSRGGSSVTGPSIRLAETIARRWGNMECGVKELSRHNGYSECVAYAWDMETNFRDAKTFQVKHWRDTKKGGYAITEERDIYELVANMGARRKRACILAVIPDDVVSAAVKQCEATLKNKLEITDETIAEIIERFAEFGVTREQIEKRIQRHMDAMTPALGVQLRKIYNSLKDGMSNPADWFEMQPQQVDADGKVITGAAALKAAVTKKDEQIDKGTGEIKGGEDPDITQQIPGAGGAPEIDWIKFQAKLENGTDVDVLDADASLIGQHPDADWRNKLTKIYQKRRAELTAPKKK